MHELPQHLVGLGHHVTLLGQQRQETVRIGDRSFFTDNLANAVFQTVEPRLELCHLTTCGLDHRNLDDGHGSEHAGSEGPPGGNFEAHDLHLSTVRPLDVRFVI